MKFVIRDDDTCGFTTPEEILTCYETMWPQIPVSLSVTPFRVPGNDRNAPENLKGNMEVIPLDKNQEIVQFLREKKADGNVDVTMHGHQHWRCHGLPEFVGCEDLADKARQGKAYLDQLLDMDIQTFVPPNNTISRIGLSAIVDAGMNLGGTVKLWSWSHREVTQKTLAYCPRVWWHQCIRRRKYPYILNLDNHQEISCHTVGPRSNFEDLRRELLYCNEQEGIFVLATHYHAFERKTDDGHTVRKMVNDLVDIANGFQDVEFVGFNTIWN